MLRHHTLTVVGKKAKEMLGLSIAHVKQIPVQLVGVMCLASCVGFDKIEASRQVGIQTSLSDFEGVYYSKSDSSYKSLSWLLFPEQKEMEYGDNDALVEIRVQKGNRMEAILSHGDSIIHFKTLKGKFENNYLL